jgi:3-hydroxymyristoyl/3-hydroxydecanoyl-(acyl carrier protein) dehydratase
MRFLLYDEVTGIDKGKSIIGIKTFTLTEPFLDRHFSRKPLIPSVLFIETMAQLLGWLIIYSHDFQLSTFLSLVEGARVPAGLRPGFQAEVHAEITSTCRRDSLGRAAMVVGGVQVASIERIIYGHFQQVDADLLRRQFGYYSGLKDLVKVETGAYDG